METIDDIVREMRGIRPDCDDCISNHTCDYLIRFADRIAKAKYENWLEDKSSIIAEMNELRDENERLKAELAQIVWIEHKIWEEGEKQ